MILSINYIFYETSGGDLSRIGKISIQKEYRNIFKDDFQKQIKYHDLSEIDLNKESSINILNIGDSFSKQGVIGYQNYLSSYNLNIFNIFTGLNNTDDPMQLVFSIVNGDILDKLKVDLRIEEAKLNGLKSIIPYIVESILRRQVEISINEIKKMIEEIEKKI